MTFTCTESTLVWSIRHPVELEILKQRGVLRADGRRIDRDFKPAYLWMIEQMKQHVGPPSPRCSKYPLWGWVQYDGVKKPRPDLRRTGLRKRGETYVLLELTMPKAQLLCSDYDKWHLVLCNWYVSNSLKEADLFEEKYGIYRQGLSSIDYPEPLLLQIRQSWKRIFEFNENPSPLCL